ncbi:MAG: hypothetical protein HOO96_36900, partial [Polyangiaceae bacterium]|nr:hypothetical protein [Polyangiaceae bacterium]
MAAALPVTGCWVVIGESFDGYSRRGDGGGVDGGAPDAVSDVVEDRPPLPPGFTSAPHAVGTCLAKFTVSNNVGYPPSEIVPTAMTIVPITDAADPTDKLDTDKDPRCYRTTPELPYCLLYVSTLEITSGAVLGAFGSRPVAIVATGDITIRQDGVLNVGAFDAPQPGGPGAHDGGNALTFRGGGGNAEPGASGCTDQGGAAISPAGLVGGGNGGKGRTDGNPACRQGGGGGGAVQLVSLCGTVRLDGNGTIDATGGGGGTSNDPACPGGFGGGAGGTVWV